MRATYEPYGSFCKEIINLCAMRTANTAIKKFDCSKGHSLGYIKNHKDQPNGKDTHS